MVIRSKERCSFRSAIVFGSVRLKLKRSGFRVQGSRISVEAEI